MIGSLLLQLSGWTIDVARHCKSPWWRRRWINLSNRLLEWEFALAGLPRPSHGTATAADKIKVYRGRHRLTERLVALESIFAKHFASSDWEATDEQVPATLDVARDLMRQGFSFFKKLDPSP
jgi:hypothetical protein